MILTTTTAVAADLRVKNKKGANASFKTN